MYITINISILCILGLLLLGLLILNIVLLYKYHYMKDEYELDKSEFLYKSNKLSMIEYHYRNYKEGKNPYTTLRDIKEVLYGSLGRDKLNND